MTSIDNNPSLTKILDRLGVQNTQGDQRADKSTLGQQDFLKLMTTQLQNQDPFSPMENGEFIAQMAQFSTVTGITEMGQTLKTLSGQLAEFRMATATNLLGHAVLVPGKKAYPDEAGAVHGVIDLPVASGATSIVYKSMTGEILHSENLGALRAGLNGFAWEDIPQSVLDKNDYIMIDAFAEQDQKNQNVEVSVFSDVLATSADPQEGVMLEVRGYGDISASEALRFRHKS